MCLEEFNFMKSIYLLLGKLLDRLDNGLFCSLLAGLKWKNKSFVKIGHNKAENRRKIPFKAVEDFPWQIREALTFVRRATHASGQFLSPSLSVDNEQAC